MRLQTNTNSGNAVVRCRPEYRDSSAQTENEEKSGSPSVSDTSLETRKEATVVETVVPEQTRIPSNPNIVQVSNRPRGRRRSQETTKPRQTVKLSGEEKRLVCAIGTALRSIAKENDEKKLAGKKRELKKKKWPKAPLENYLERMCLYLNNWRYARCAKGGCSAGMRALCITMIYIDRLYLHDPEFELSEQNMRRLCAVGMLLATKYLEDNIFRNAYWCIVSSMSIPLLNQAEMEFCEMIKFDLRVTSVDFDNCLDTLRRSVAPPVCERTEGRTPSV